MLPVYLCEEHHVVQNQCILKTNLFEESTIAFVHLHSKLDCGVYPDLDAKFTLSAVATLLRRSGLTDALVALVLRHVLSTIINPVLVRYALLIARLHILQSNSV